MYLDELDNSVLKNSKNSPFIYYYCVTSEDGQVSHDVVIEKTGLVTAIVITSDARSACKDSYIKLNGELVSTPFKTSKSKVTISGPISGAYFIGNVKSGDTLTLSSYTSTASAADNHFLYLINII